jgi:hypothetical protein
MPDLLRNDGCPWLQEKSREIKEMTVKGLQPEIERLLAKHKAEIRRYRERGAGGKRGREGERGRGREREPLSSCILQLDLQWTAAQREIG